MSKQTVPPAPDLAEAMKKSSSSGAGRVSPPSAIGPAPAYRRSQGTHAPPSLTDALVKKAKEQ